jgi:hypothetical protein
MGCDPLGWFLTADWPPFDHPFRIPDRVRIYSIKAASLSGSITPFCTLLRSKPFSDSARRVTETVPARSARLATAFQAAKSSLRSAENAISTTF